MKMTGNLAVKITAVILTILFGAVCALSLIGIWLAAEQGHYSSVASDFYNTSFCSDLAYEDYCNVTGYVNRLMQLRTERAIADASAAGTENSPADIGADGASPDDAGETGIEEDSLPMPADILRDVPEGTFNQVSGVEDSYLNFFEKILTSENFKYEVKTTSGKLLFGTYAGEEYGYNASFSYQDIVAPSLYNSSGYAYEYDKSSTDISYNVIINCYVLNPISSGDAYYYYYQFDRFLDQNKTLMPVVFIICAFICIILTVFLLCAAGHRADREEVVPNLQDKIPFDVYLVVMGGLFLLCGMACFHYTPNRLNLPEYLVNVLGLTGCGSIFLTVLLTTATRIKLRTVFRNTLIYRLLRWTVRLAKAVPLVWKGVLAAAGVIFIEFIFILFFHFDVNFLLIVWWLGFHALLFLGALYLMKMLKQLQQSGEMLAAGNLEYRTDTSSLLGDFKKHAENLNSVRLGMSKAVEEKMKSERFKTELITNVSHDIKTPLTSIINYIDLLKKEEIGSPAADSYLEVLERQSARLKKLIEDLVEASKASTGNISVQLSKTRVGELISQSAAEYGDRFAAAGLEPIVDCEADLLVWADGRLLWRVLDNLLGNICKYALTGTRVYISARAERSNRVEITLKNISSQPLNIEPEELMERFVRGDGSRSTEGSGLGLSIARSLTELQRGEFSIDVDGDLFKATIHLLSAPEQVEKNSADPG